jgi:Putative peptidoglycan binding domain
LGVSFAVSDDFGFEFVDEQTEEAAQPTSRRVFRPPEQRLNSAGLEGIAARRRWVAGAIAVVIVLIVIVVLVTGGSSSKAGSYRAYFAKLTPVAVDSGRVGASLSRLLGRVTSGLLTDPSSMLDQLARTAQTDLAAATRLNPPAGLLAAHQQALSALGFRVQALEELAKSLASRQTAVKIGARTSAVANAIDLLVTSDVLWRRFVWEPASAALEQVGLAASLAPRSIFVTDETLTAPQSAAALVQPHTPGATVALTLGSNGPAVVAWQKQLNVWLRQKHQQAVTPDGTYGPGTQVATQTFQRAAGLTPDGTVGPATRKALQKALGG